MDYSLKLFICGKTAISQRAIKNLNAITSDIANFKCSVELVDIQKEPHLASAEKILATPALVRMLPAPRRKIIGDLSDIEKVVSLLESVKLGE